MIIKTILLKNDIPVFGIRVRHFPEQIGDAFGQLVTRIDDQINRTYYGICGKGGEGLIYWAAAEELTPGEADRYHCEATQVQRGLYLSVKITAWREKIPAIQQVFLRMKEDPRADQTKPIVEWYTNDEVMYCLVPSRST
jgi:hypothetical protein